MYSYILKTMARYSEMDPLDNGGRVINLYAYLINLTKALKYGHTVKSGETRPALNASARWQDMRSGDCHTLCEQTHQNLLALHDFYSVM
jgi:hypothetical protein